LTQGLLPVYKDDPLPYSAYSLYIQKAHIKVPFLFSVKFLLFISKKKYEKRSTLLILINMLK